MHFCTNCGTKRAPEAKFCGECGARMDAVGPTAPQATAPQATAPQAASQQFLETVPPPPASSVPVPRARHQQYDTVAQVVSAFERSGASESEADMVRRAAERSPQAGDALVSSLVPGLPLHVARIDGGQHAVVLTYAPDRVVYGKRGVYPKVVLLEPSGKFPAGSLLKIRGSFSPLRAIQFPFDHRKVKKEEVQGAAAARFRKGSRVWFKGKGGAVVHGIVDRVNQTTVSLHEEDQPSRKWRVAPTSLRAAA